jgi:multicomponent Na+:H+ antiporter subunit G
MMWVILLFALAAFFMAVAGLGVLRMPDVFMRMQAATKASALGAAFAFAAVAVHFHDVSVTGRAVAGILFLFLTVPIAGHLIGRAAYRTGAPLAEGTKEP